MSTSILVWIGLGFHFKPSDFVTTIKAPLPGCPEGHSTNASLSYCGVCGSKIVQEETLVPTLALTTLFKTLDKPLQHLDDWQMGLDYRGSPYQVIRDHLCIRVGELDAHRIDFRHDHAHSMPMLLELQKKIESLRDALGFNDRAIQLVYTGEIC